MDKADRQTDRHRSSECVSFWYNICSRLYDVYIYVCVCVCVYVCVCVLRLRVFCTLAYISHMAQTSDTNSSHQGAYGNYQLLVYTNRNHRARWSLKAGYLENINGFDPGTIIFSIPPHLTRCTTAISSKEYGRMYSSPSTAYEHLFCYIVSRNCTFLQITM